MGIALAAVIMQTILGLSDREIVEQLSDEDRAQLEQAYGTAEEAVAYARNIAETSGIPQMSMADLPGDISPAAGMQGSLYFGERPEGGALNLAGAIEGGPEGWFLNIPNMPHPFPLQQRDTGELFYADEARGELPLTITSQPTDAQAAAGFWDRLRGFVPQPPSAFEAANIPMEAPLDREALIRELADLSGGFLQRGDLGRVTAADLMPERLTDPEAWRASAESELYGREGEQIQTEQVQSRRALTEAGVLPSSATFGFESEAGPRQRSAERTARELTEIGAETETIAGRNAEIEARMREAAAQINAQLAATETSQINQQMATLSGLSTDVERTNIEAGRLRLDAARQDVANQFNSFAAEMGISQAQIDQFHQMITLNASLSSQAAQIGMQVAIEMIRAEGQYAPSTVLLGDIATQAANTGLMYAQMWQMFNPQEDENQTSVGFAPMGMFGPSGDVTF
jgi:hypothetical protein